MNDDPNRQLEEDALNIISDMAELGVDAVLDEGLLRDIPMVGTVIGVVRMARTVPDLILRAKVARFLSSMPQISQQDRQRFYEEIKNQTRQAKKIGEVLLLLLDRFSDLEKPEILATLFAALVMGRINMEEFRRLGQAVDLAFVDDLRNVVRLEDIHQYEAARNNLVRSGLTELRLEKDEPAPKLSLRNPGSDLKKPSGYIPESILTSSSIELTNLGNLFIEIMLQNGW